MAGLRGWGLVAVESTAAKFTLCCSVGVGGQLAREKQCGRHCAHKLGVQCMGRGHHARRLSQDGSTW